MSIFSTIKAAILKAAQRAPAVTPAVAAALSLPAQDFSASEIHTPDKKIFVVLFFFLFVVDATLEALAAKDYQTSIVVLLMLLGLDSSLSHRKELAKELNYPSDPASMNIWLHAEVMTRLATEGCLFRRTGNIRQGGAKPRSPEPPPAEAAGPVGI